jgi:hypothetical protein
VSKGGEAVGQARKLPFANYDVVVYFGVGICCLPFLYRYVLSTGTAKLPPVFAGYDDPLINNVVSIVCLIFGIYIIGHGLAILASLFIEQFLYRTIGPPSHVIVKNALPSLDGDRNFRNIICDRIKRSYFNDFHFADLVRIIFHAPVIPLYMVMYFIGFYGYYQSKLSGYIVLRVQDRLVEFYDYPHAIIDGEKWFKVVEYACANDHSAAMGKMYNYLTIYGLFRSLSFLILACLWMEYFFYFDRGGIGYLDRAGHGSFLFRMSVIYGAYVVSFIGFAKFTRRYSEEAIQAFSLSSVFAPPESNTTKP